MAAHAAMPISHRLNDARGGTKGMKGKEGSSIFCPVGGLRLHDLPHPLPEARFVIVALQVAGSSH